MAPKLKPTKRPLRYSPTAWDHSGRAITWNKGEEKGIDVLLALSMTLGALRTGAMRSKPVSQLLVDLGVVRSHSRPHVSNDNPFSEAQFKTIKYCPLFPERFDSIEQAREFCVDFFGHYNHIHHHGRRITIGRHGPRRRVGWLASRSHGSALAPGRTRWTQSVVATPAC